MQMDTRLPLMGQAVNPLQAYTQGVSARDAVEEMSRQNALQEFLQTNGQALYAGDPNAIREFANYDLQGAMGLQQQFEAQRRAAAAAAASAGRARATAEQEALQRAFDVMGVAHEQGPEAFQAALDQYGYADEAEQFGINYDNFAQTAAVARAHLGFEQPAAPEQPEFLANIYAAADAAGMDRNSPEIRSAIARAGGVTPEEPEMPASYRALELRARAAGLEPGTPEHQAFMVNGGAPDGMSLSVNPETGQVEFATGAAATGGGASGSEFNTRLDRAVAEDVAEWESDGRATAQMNLAMLGRAIETIEGGENVSGPLVGTLLSAVPGVAAITSPTATDVYENITGVVQQSLRTILGAQFTEREGERLIARAYNPRLDEATNTARLRALENQMQVAYQQREAMSEYARVNGTMVGYDGPRPSLADFHAAIDGATTNPVTAGSNITPGAPDAAGGAFNYGAETPPPGFPEPDLWPYLTPEQRALWAN